MKQRILTVAAGALMSLAAQLATADVLRGHLSGLDDPDARVDLRVQFYRNDITDRPLAVRRFEAVSLRDGQFVVRFDHTELPATARFVELALRPSARRYAAFRGIPPRRRLERLANGTLVATATAHDPAESGIASSLTPVSQTLTDPGDFR